MKTVSHRVLHAGFELAGRKRMVFQTRTMQTCKLKILRLKHTCVMDGPEKASMIQYRLEELRLRLTTSSTHTANLHLILSTFREPLKVYKLGRGMIYLEL